MVINADEAGHSVVCPTKFATLQLYQLGKCRRRRGWVVPEEADQGRPELYLGQLTIVLPVQDRIATRAESLCDFRTA